MRLARVSGAAILVMIVLLALGGSGIAIYASPTCQRFVRTFVTVPVRNRVSKKTVEAWAKWRVGHPNWKPNPAVQRPKYVMSRKEALEKVTFACEVPNVPGTLDMGLPPIDLGDLPPLGGLTPVVGAPPDLGLPPASALPPVETAELTYPGLIPPESVQAPPFEAPGAPGGGGGGVPGFFIPPAPLPPPYTGETPGTSTTSSTPVPPVVPPIIPPASAVPEPPTLWLVALGFAVPCALCGLRIKSWKQRRYS
jgi:hypothetical protein